MSGSGGVVRAALRVLAFVDEKNLMELARSFNRKLDWNTLPSFLANPEEGRDLIELVVYVGLPPNVPGLEERRNKKLKFVHALRKLGYMVQTKEGSPAGHDDRGNQRFKANVDVLMAIDAMDLATQIRPDVVVLVTGDSDFAHLATSLRRRGIRVEVAALDNTNLGIELKVAASSFIDLRELFNSFANLRPDHDGGRIGGDDVFDDAH